MKTKEIRSFADADISKLKLPIICVYQHPDDYPDKCVARIFDGERATDIAITRNTVDEIREDILKHFPTMQPFGRYKRDYKSYVESWF